MRLKRGGLELVSLECIYISWRRPWGRAAPQGANRPKKGHDHLARETQLYVGPPANPILKALSSWGHWLGPFFKSQSHPGNQDGAQMMQTPTSPLGASIIPSLGKGLHHSRGLVIMNNVLNT